MDMILTFHKMFYHNIKYYIKNNIYKIVIREFIEQRDLIEESNTIYLITFLY